MFAHDTSSYFGKRSGVVLLSSIDCTGTELALHACKSSSYEPHHCSHDTDVGVRCEETEHSGLFIQHSKLYNFTFVITLGINRPSKLH